MQQSSGEMAKRLSDNRHVPGVVGSAIPAVEEAVRFFIGELNTICLAEQIELAGRANWEKKAHAQLRKADALLGKGWDILLRIGYSDGDIAAIRHLSHATYGAKMGWDSERQLCVLGRAYSFRP